MNRLVGAVCGLLLLAVATPTQAIPMSNLSGQDWGLSVDWQDPNGTSHNDTFSFLNVNLNLNAANQPISLSGLVVHNQAQPGMNPNCEMGSGLDTTSGTYPSADFHVIFLELFGCNSYEGPTYLVGTPTVSGYCRPDLPPSSVVVCGASLRDVNASTSNTGEIEAQNQVVPEPSTLLLIASGLAVIRGRYRRRT